MKNSEIAKLGIIALVGFVIGAVLGGVAAFITGAMNIWRGSILAGLLGALLSTLIRFICRSPSILWQTMVSKAGDAYHAAVNFFSNAEKKGRVAGERQHLIADVQVNSEETRARASSLEQSTVKTLLVINEVNDQLAVVTDGAARNNSELATLVSTLREGSVESNARSEDYTGKLLADAEALSIRVRAALFGDDDGDDDGDDAQSLASTISSVSFDSTG